MKILAWKSAPVFEDSPREVYIEALLALMESLGQERPIHFRTVMDYHGRLKRSIIRFEGQTFEEQ